jgi:hypothetical protein
MLEPPPELVAEKLLPAPWAQMLSPAQIAELGRRSVCNGLPASWGRFSVTQNSPSLAAAISERPCASPGLLSRDELLARTAAKYSLPAYALETQTEVEPRRQRVPDSVRAKAVYYSLSTAHAGSVRRMATAVNDGDYEAILALFREALGPNDERVLRTIMVDARNEAWLPRLTRHLTNGRVVVNVGAGHLAGPRGLPTLLRSRGYRVRPIKVPAAAPQ